MTDMDDDIRKAMAAISDDISRARKMIQSFVEETSSLSAQKTCWDTLATYAALLDYYEKLRALAEDASNCEDADDISDLEAPVRKITEGIQRIIK